MKTLLLPLLSAAMFASVAVPAAGFFEPPIVSQADAACREVARSKVFTAPDPDGLGLFENGKRIYKACMATAPSRPATVVKASQVR
jgi:hypothetical protein